MAAGTVELELGYDAADAGEEEESSLWGVALLRRIISQRGTAEVEQSRVGTSARVDDKLGRCVAVSLCVPGAVPGSLLRPLSFGAGSGEC